MREESSSPILSSTKTAFISSPGSTASAHQDLQSIISNMFLSHSRQVPSFTSMLSNNNKTRSSADASETLDGDLEEPILSKSSSDNMFVNIQLISV